MTYTLRALAATTAFATVFAYAQELKPADETVYLNETALEGRAYREGDRVYAPLESLVTVMGATLRGNELTFGDKSITVSATNQDGTRYVPVRFLTESFGATVKYDAVGDAVRVTLPEPTVPAPTPPGEVYTPDAGGATMYAPDSAGTDMYASDQANTNLYAPDAAGAVAPTDTPPTAKPSPSATSASVIGDEAATTQSFDFAKWLPWILGLLALAVIGFLWAWFRAQQARKGQVIANDAGRPDPTR